MISYKTLTIFQAKISQMSINIYCILKQSKQLREKNFFNPGKVCVRWWWWWWWWRGVVVENHV